MSHSPSRPTSFRPRFTLLLLYLIFFFFLFALLFAVPDLIRALRELPPGSGALSPAELEHAKQAARDALRGRIPLALGASAVAIGLAVWTRRLPGLR